MTAATATPPAGDDVETLERVVDALAAHDAAAEARDAAVAADVVMNLAMALVALVLLVMGLGGRAARGQDAATARAPLARQAVAARPLARGAVLTLADIDSADAPLRAPSDARVSPGWVTRRVVRAGEPLVPPAVAPPPAVAAGDSVRLTRVADGLTITLRGVAMAAAPLGARVGVRVAGRGRFEGTVIGPASVRLDP